MVLPALLRRKVQKGDCFSHRFTKMPTNIYLRGYLGHYLSYRFYSPRTRSWTTQNDCTTAAYAISQSNSFLLPYLAYTKLRWAISKLIVVFRGHKEAIMNGSNTRPIYTRKRTARSAKYRLQCHKTDQNDLLHKIWSLILTHPHMSPYNRVYRGSVRGQLKVETRQSRPATAS